MPRQPRNNHGFIGRREIQKGPLDLALPRARQFVVRRFFGGALLSTALDKGRPRAALRHTFRVEDGMGITYELTEIAPEQDVLKVNRVARKTSVEQFRARARSTI